MVLGGGKYSSADKRLFYGDETTTALPLPSARGGSRSGTDRLTGRDAVGATNTHNAATPRHKGMGGKKGVYGGTMGGAPMVVVSQRSGKGPPQGGTGSAQTGQRVAGGHHTATGDHLEGGGGLMDVDNIDEWTSLNLLHDYPNDERMQQQPRSPVKVSNVGVSGVRERDGSVLARDERGHLNATTSGKMKQKKKNLSLKQQQKDFIYLTERRKEWVR